MPSSASWTTPEPRALASLIARGAWAERSASCASRASEKPIAFSRRIPGASLGRPLDPDLLLGVDDFLQPLEEPRVEPGDRVDPLDREALAKRLGRDQQPVGRRPRQRAFDRRRIGIFELAHPVEPGEPRLQPAQRLLQALGERLRPIAITSPTDFIEVDSSASAPLNFSNAKRGILVTT